MIPIQLNEGDLIIANNTVKMQIGEWELYRKPTVDIYHTLHLPRQSVEECVDIIIDATRKIFNDDNSSNYKLSQSVYNFIKLSGSKEITNLVELLSNVFKEILETEHKKILEIDNPTTQIRTLAEFVKKYLSRLNMLYKTLEYINILKNKMNGPVFNIGCQMLLRYTIHVDKDLLCTNLTNVFYNGDPFAIELMQMILDIYESHNMEEWKTEFIITLEKCVLAMIYSEEREDDYDKIVEDYNKATKVISHTGEYLNQELSDRVKEMLFGAIGDDIYQLLLQKNHQIIQSLLRHPDNLVRLCYTINTSGLDKDEFIDTLLTYCENLFKSIVIDKSLFKSNAFSDNLNDLISDALSINDIFEDKTLINPRFGSCIREFFKQDSDLIRYLCVIVKHMIKKSNDDDKQVVRRKINNIITVSQWFDEGDVFINNYKNCLADRIMNKNLDLDFEIELINVIGQIHGTEYANDMYKMVGDIKANKRDNGEIKEMSITVESDEFKDVELDMKKVKYNIFTNGVWPQIEQQDSECILPNEINIYMKVFEGYYNSKYENNRTIKWLLDTSEIVINASFGNKKYKIQMNISQAILLHMFNYDNKLSYNEILEKSNMSVVRLGKTLNSLVKAKLLFIEKDEDENIHYIYNKHFHSKDSNISIMKLFHSKNVTKKSNKTHCINSEMLIDTKVVGQIKKNKETGISEEDLFKNTIESLQGRFTPTKKMIKDRIKSLIERELIDFVDDKYKLFV